MAGSEVLVEAVLPDVAALGAAGDAAAARKAKMTAWATAPEASATASSDTDRAGGRAPPGRRGPDRGGRRRATGSPGRGGRARHRAGRASVSSSAPSPSALRSGPGHEGAGLGLGLVPLGPAHAAPAVGRRVAAQGRGNRERRPSGATRWTGAKATGSMSSASSSAPSASPRARSPRVGSPAGPSSWRRDRTEVPRGRPPAVLEVGGVVERVGAEGHVGGVAPGAVVPRRRASSTSRRSTSRAAPTSGRAGPGRRPRSAPGRRAPRR